MPGTYNVLPVFTSINAMNFFHKTIYSIFFICLGTNLTDKNRVSWLYNWKTDMIQSRFIFFWSKVWMKICSKHLAEKSMILVRRVIQQKNIFLGYIVICFMGSSFANSTISIRIYHDNCRRCMTSNLVYSALQPKKIIICIPMWMSV